MLRQERFGAGMADQKNLDAQFARAIMGDGKFEVTTIIYLLFCLLILTSRMTWNILMTMLRNSVDRKCGLTL